MRSLSPLPLVLLLLLSSYLLSQHPDAEAAILQELRDAGVPCGGNVAATCAALSMDLLNKLPHCTAVLSEAMRLFPAGVAATPR